jgi:aryl-alcohol dehydrogenase-like predicted oxidoreductase
VQYRQLGKTDIKVSVVAAGSWASGGTNWGEVDDDASIKAIRRSLDLGVNLVDTAPVYGKGHSEEIVGRALDGRRSAVLISTKCGLLIEQKNRRSLRPDDVRGEVEASLKRLRTDHIDILFCHWPDTTTPIEETVGALTDLQRVGVIRAFGLSNHGPDHIRRAAAAGPLTCLQEHYSLVMRDIEKETLPLAAELGLGVLAYGPLGGGILTGKYREKPAFAGKDVRDFFYPFYKEPGWGRVQGLLTEIAAIADARKAPLAHVAIAWANQRPGITCSLVGAKTEDQSQTNAAAGDLALTTDEVRRLTAASDTACAKD